MKLGNVKCFYCPASSTMQNSHEILAHSNLHRKIKLIIKTYKSSLIYTNSLKVKIELSGLTKDKVMI